jgi:tetratricopeptide (TPR) repeat protein
LIGLIIGFIAANKSLRNNSEIQQMQTAKAETKPKTQETPQISDEELSAKIAEADKNPNDIEFQKDLGIALFKFSNMQNDSKYLPDVIRLLKRAEQKNPKDYDVIVVLADAYLSLGKGEKKQDEVKKSREYYQKALQIRPDDVEAITNLGLSYLPEEKDKAMAEFEKTLKLNPKHERTLEILKFLNK